MMCGLIVWLALALSDALHGPILARSHLFLYFLSFTFSPLIILSLADVAKLAEFADWSLSDAPQYMTHHLDPVPQTTKVTPLADEDDQDEQGGDDHIIW